MGANCTSHSVPLEIYSLLLSYLPVKSLLRFRSVCQEWKLIIGSRYFASLHLSQYANNRLESRLIEVESRDNPSSWWVNRFHVSQLYSQSLEFDFSGPAELLLSQDSYTVIAAHIAGLFLLVRGTHDIMRCRGLVVWNPSIRKVLNIPLPPSSKSQVHGDFGLGYDPSTNDYKVVRIIRTDEGRNTTLEIFSLHSHSWRSKSNVCCQFDWPLDILSLGGFVHWLLLKTSPSYGEKELLSFDMSSETISQTLLPIMLSNEPYMNRTDQLIALTGSLIGLLSSYQDTTELWVLDKDKRWSKIFMFDTCMPDIWLYLEKDGLLIWKSYHTDDDDVVAIVLASNLITGKTSLMSLHDQLSVSPIYIGTYIESLALLN